MSGNGLTPDEYRSYQAHMKRRERRARAERERVEQEKTKQEGVAEERAEQETAEQDTAGEQAAHPADISENIVVEDISSSPLLGSYLDYTHTAFNRIAAIWQCLCKYRWPIVYSIVVLMFGHLVKFILDTPIPFPGGTIGGFIMLLVKIMYRDPRLLPDLFTPARSLSCICDAPVFTVRGKFLSDIAQVLDDKTVEGVNFSFDETLLLQVNQADDRLSTVTTSISDHSYDICRHISHLDEIMSSKPSWLSSVLQSLSLEHSKETKIQKEAESFLSTLNHSITTRSEMINRTKAGHESIRQLQKEFCNGRDQVLSIKTDIFTKLSAKEAALKARENYTALRRYITGKLNGVDIANLRLENMALWQQLVEADDFRIYIALGCSGSEVSWYEMRRLEKALKENDKWSKTATGKVMKTLDRLHKGLINLKVAGEDVTEIMKDYEGDINRGHYERT
ncbi:hypothetical protein FDENT_9657 [Fusarium denticulatum]|uniref:Uncharacterized protein n=1 Tax=Fusarium denticulatum TaxID=48507 RepID=A0A8H5WXI5_9HYPO|nr:hypothetical protein FDENT_9657 [Fusarium denticulatum]